MASAIDKRPFSVALDVDNDARQPTDVATQAEVIKKESGDDTIINECPTTGECSGEAGEIPINQDVALHLLEKLGYTADLIGSEREALQVMMKAAYNIIIKDSHMPEIDQ